MGDNNQDLPIEEPVNFRSLPLRLFGQSIEVSGMARPTYRRTYAAGKEGPLTKELILMRMNKLVEKQGESVIIGLFQSSLEEVCGKAGLTYHHMPIPDFETRPIDPSVYDAIYKQVEQATAQGKKVTIHCGSGNGRTGTALAALKLRELIEEKLLIDPGYFNRDIQTDTSIPVDEQDVACSALTKQAIEAVRAVDATNDNDNDKSLEMKNDVDTLVVYEKHLQALLRPEIQQALQDNANEHPDTRATIEKFSRMKEGLFQVIQRQEPIKTTPIPNEPQENHDENTAPKPKL